MNAIGEQSLPWFAAEEASAPPSLTALVADYSTLLYRVALSILRNPAEAEDVVQDVFLRVLERKHQLNRIAEIRPWLIRIAWNLAIDRRRRIRPDQMDDIFAAGLVSNSLPADRTFAEAAHIHQTLAAIDNLPTRERQALLLSAMEELSTAEIAVVLNKTESTVRSLIFRARTHLRQRLKE
jgi:RNA polymerase sigma-70 factor (ECF subfamily)